MSVLAQEPIERIGAEQEAGLIKDYSLQNALSNIQDRRLEADRAFQRSLAREGWDRQNDLQRTLARKNLQGQLIGGAISGGLGAVGGFF